MERGEIRLKNETVAAYPDYFLSRGVPLPPGEVHEPTQVSIVDAQGRPLPFEGAVLQRRPDGSIEWLLMDLIVSLAPEEKASLFIETRPARPAPVAHPVAVSERGDEVVVSNGIVELSVGRRGSLIRRLAVHGREIVGEPDLVDLETVDTDDKVYRASISDGYAVSLERSNRLRATVLVQGTHAARDGSTFLDFALRLTVAANRADVRLEHTTCCRQPSPGITEVKAIRLVMPTRMPGDAAKVLHQAHHGHSWWPRFVEVPENVEVVASSVDDLNRYAEHYKPYQMGRLFLRNLSSLHEDLSQVPFHMRPGGESGFRKEHMIGGFAQVYPYVGWRSQDTTVVFAMRHWAQFHPKSMALDENVLTVGIWPEWATPLRLMQGVSKTHTFWLAAAPAALTPEQVEAVALQWEVQGVEPLDVSFDPAWPAHCRVADCQHLLRYQPDKYGNLENRLRAAPGEPSRFTYPRHNPTGMLNFGDHGGEGGFTNNEDDLRVYAPLQAYLRTGQTFNFDFGSEAAAHYMEVDHCAWSTDPRQRGGFIPHTVDHFIGNVYSSHQWAEGVLLYYYLTGDERARQAVVSCGENQIYWVENLLDVVCCDGREAGMPLVNLAAAYRLTRDERYVRAARTIIENFQKKWFDRWGDLRYPYPQGAHLMWITGYGDWSSYYGLYRPWEQTGDGEVRRLLIALLEKLCVPERFSVDDARGMDFQSVWQYVHLTGDLGVIEKLRKPIENFLKKGGHPLRRLHFLKVLDEQGRLTDEP